MRRRITLPRGLLATVVFWTLMFNNLDDGASAPVEQPTIPVGQTILTEEDRLLDDLMKSYLGYFIENQYGPEAPIMIRGLIRDRQSNFGASCKATQASTATTGMGCIAIALASDPDYHLITHDEAVARIKMALQTALRLPHEQGIGPHFVDIDGTIKGRDKFSTVDWAWLLAGAGWSASFLHSEELETLFQQLYRRVDWQYWTHGSESGLLRHGRHQDGSLLTCCWDRLNAETLILYILATGAEDKGLPPTVWTKLEAHRVDGILSGDLGLFVHQLGLELFAAENYLTDLTGINLLAEHEKAVSAHLQAKEHSNHGFWGLSTGDSPSQIEGKYEYKESSLTQNDGTFNITVSVASLRANPHAVISNLVMASSKNWSDKLEGRYGFANVNVRADGSCWVAPDAVGFDIGGAVLSIANYRHRDRVREVFGQLPLTRRAVQHLKKAV